MHVTSLIHELDLEQAERVLNASKKGLTCFIALEEDVYYVTRDGSAALHAILGSEQEAYQYALVNSEKGYQPTELKVTAEAVNTLKHVVGRQGKLWSYERALEYMSEAIAYTASYKHMNGLTYAIYKTYVFVIDNSSIVRVERFGKNKHAELLN